MLDDVLKGVDLLKQLLSDWQNRRKRLDAETMRAISAVEEAALATRSYLADQRLANSADREQELKLASLWHEAHRQSLGAGQYMLADRCLIKADGWSDPMMWESPRYEGIPVDLDSIIDSCRELARSLPRRDVGTV